MDDEFDGAHPLRKKHAPSMGAGNTPYALDMYGATPEDQRIPPLDRPVPPCFLNIHKTTQKTPQKRKVSRASFW